jgi:hypothetical protein
MKNDFTRKELRRAPQKLFLLGTLTVDIHHRLFDGENSPINRAQRYLISRFRHVKHHLLTRTLFEMAFIQNPDISSESRGKIKKALLKRTLTVAPDDNSKYFKMSDKKMTFEDQSLLNSMTMSLYDYFGDYRTSADIVRWVVSQIQTHPHYDTLLDAVFQTEAWFKVDCLLRRELDKAKFDVTVDVSANNGEKRQFKIDSTNMHVTQRFRFTLPVHQISYLVNGFGSVAVLICEMFFEQEQKLVKPLPFQLTNELEPKPGLTKIKAKTCLTYTPTHKDRQLARDNLNRTLVLEVQVPSGKNLV